MNRRGDGNSDRPGQPRRLALVDADVSTHHAVREYFTCPAVGWQVDAYPTPQAAGTGLASAPPSVVLIDICPPTATGLACLRHLRARLPEVPVVVYSAQACAGMLLRALAAGARGYLVKPQPPAELRAHLEKVLAGGLALCRKAERCLLEDLQRLGHARTVPGLSLREQELMHCLCQHPSNKQCALALGISEATVHAHLARIFKKLGVHDRESAIRVFTQHLHGGGGKTPGRGSAGIRLFLDLLRACRSDAPRLQSAQTTTLDRQQ